MLPALLHKWEWMELGGMHANAVVCKLSSDILIHSAWFSVRLGVPICAYLLCVMWAANQISFLFFFFNFHTLGKKFVILTEYQWDAGWSQRSLHFKERKICLQRGRSVSLRNLKPAPRIVWVKMTPYAKCYIWVSLRWLHPPTSL